MVLQPFAPRVQHVQGVHLFQQIHKHIHTSCCICSANLCPHVHLFSCVFAAVLCHTRASACKTWCKQSLWLGCCCTSEVSSADTCCLFTHAIFVRTGRKARTTATLLPACKSLLHHSMSTSVLPCYFSCFCNVAFVSHVQCAQSRQTGRLAASASSRCCQFIVRLCMQLRASHGSCELNTLTALCKTSSCFLLSPLPADAVFL